MEGDLRWCCGSISNDWDLHAVVRFATCSGGSHVVTSPRASDDESFSGLPLPPPQSQADEVPDAAAFQPQLPIGPAVDDFCLQQALFATPQPRNEAPPPAKPRTSYRNNGGGPTPSKKKKRKKTSQVSNKEVTRVPMGTSPDPWAWRKYGQKPIKGSPYPRGYYRCSTDKGCRARKQVERCCTDPTTIIVSYTGGEHSHPVPLHRSSLAGTTRKNKQQPASSTSPAEQPPAASLIDTSTPLLLCPSVGVEWKELEDAELEEEEDVLLFPKSAPSPT